MCLNTLLVSFEDWGIFFDDKIIKHAKRKTKTEPILISKWAFKMLKQNMNKTN